MVLHWHRATSIDKVDRPLIDFFSILHRMRLSFCPLFHRPSMSIYRLFVSIIRHALFYMGLLVWLIVLIPAGIALCFVPQKWTFWGSRIYCKILVWLYQWILGISFRTTGLDDLPSGPCIIACKHQSYWETIALMTIIENPAFVLKAELMRIPLLGSVLRKLDMIPVTRHRLSSTSLLDQSHSLGSVRSTSEQFLDQAQKVTQVQKRRLIIFPEGTRSRPGKPIRYRKGVSILAQQLKLPVVPVALNSALFTPGKGLITKPGVIDIVFLPALSPTLSSEVLMEKLTSIIETQSKALLPESDTP
jgi:1-acyl-sn-glycerol-3-phosphate acyltransferase